GLQRPARGPGLREVAVVVEVTERTPHADRDVERVLERQLPHVRALDPEARAAGLVEEPVGDVHADDVEPPPHQALRDPSGATRDVQSPHPGTQPGRPDDQVHLVVGVLERFPSELDRLPRGQLEHLLPPAAHAHPHRTSRRTRSIYPARRASLSITVDALRPGTPITPPPGCVPAPHRYR